MAFNVKEMFYSLQGEGARAGRAAVFCRLSKCNLWNGREQDRQNAICNFCDTDIVGVDGQNGGVFETSESLAKAITALWREHAHNDHGAKPYVIFTGGEPLLQLSAELTSAMHQNDFEVAVETNGTRPLVPGIDWVCLSPKGLSQVVLDQCDELKFVYPQLDVEPKDYQTFPACHYFLSPMASPHLRAGKDAVKDKNTAKALQYCLENPQWRLTVQMHKLLGID